MKNLGRFTVSASLLAALMALPCVCSALPSYDESSTLCHDAAQGAYLVAVARGSALPDGEYESEMAACEYDVYRAHLLADPAVSLNELIAFDNTDADDASLPYPH